MPYEVRIVVPEQIVHLVRDLDDYLRGLYPGESCHLMSLEDLRKPGVTVFAASLPEVGIIGCCALCHHGEYGELKRMYVQPRHRGRGVGGVLMRRLEEAAQAGGLSKLCLETGISQPEAVRLYAYFGYVRRGPFGSYKDDPMSVFMEKSLSGSSPSEESPDVQSPG